MKGTNNLLYLPLDRLLKPATAPVTAPVSAAPLSEALPSGSTPSVDGSAAATRLRDLSRSREVR